MRHMHPVHVPRKIPIVLSPDEVARLIGAAGNLKNQTALSVAYGAGLRVSEVAALKVSDIDSQRMTLRIEQGKGGKGRSDQQARFDAHPAPQLRHPFAGAEGGYSRDSGLARAQEAGEYGALYSGGDQDSARSGQPAGYPASRIDVV